ncbi:hypothetical protein [Actinomyces sp. MRS3W]|uniref:hypothetical protein n=1 Tax=Actinomyces sp. MRS3W TaxID=2800796 RepID=UPI0028FD9B9F|nr:hypothetical protein [Actinomyces sp. MRS3W]MDU0349637.1 hypothetical protein [Actinomyces sp. MRS3W]
MCVVVDLARSLSTWTLSAAHGRDPACDPSEAGTRIGCLRLGEALTLGRDNAVVVRVPRR